MCFQVFLKFVNGAVHSQRAIDIKNLLPRATYTIAVFTFCANKSILTFENTYCKL